VVPHGTSGTNSPYGIRCWKCLSARVSPTGTLIASVSPGEQQGRRTKSLDLSSSFREQRLIGPSQTKGLPDETDEAACDETSPPNLERITEGSTSNRDPVTERLMAIMRQKVGR
jgi:hypothetical protein